MRKSSYFRAASHAGLVLFTFLGLTATSARAEGSPEFEAFQRRLAELTGKVDLFQEIWRLDPSAEISGGAARDFVYWVKGAFKVCKGEAACLERVHSDLLARPSIEARLFLPVGSDIDVVSRENLSRVDVSKYLLKRIDAIDPDRFDPATALGKSEIDQGYIPAEKIRIGRAGTRAESHFGNGVWEIFSGKLRVHYAKRTLFELTHYAKLGINHPILLALRYVKLLSMNDHFEHPNQPISELNRVLKGAVTADIQATKAVFRETASDPRFSERLKIDKFRDYVNQAASKAFGPRTNSTATRALFADLGAEAVWISGGKALQPINHFLYARSSDRAETLRKLRELGVAEPEKILVDVEGITGGRIYHGTRTEESFQGIVLHGAFPSGVESSVGTGLYAVEKKYLKIAKGFARSEDLVVEIPISSGAIVFDSESPEYLKAYAEFKHRGLGDGFDAFAEYVGADGLYYAYQGKRAFAIKNAAVLGKANGWTRQVLDYAELREVARSRPTGAVRTNFVAALFSLPMNYEQMQVILREGAFPKTFLGHLAAIDIELRAKGESDAVRTLVQKLAIYYFELVSDPHLAPEELEKRLRGFQAIAASAIESKVSMTAIERAFARPAGVSAVAEGALLRRVLNLMKERTKMSSRAIRGFMHEALLTTVGWGSASFLIGAQLSLFGPFTGNYLVGAGGVLWSIASVVVTTMGVRSAKRDSQPLRDVRADFVEFEKRIEDMIHLGCPALLKGP